MVDTTLLIGTLGVVFLAVAWLPEIIQTIRERESKINPKFAVIYFIGTFFLMMYAIFLKNIPFTIVNGLILGQVCINLYYEFVVERGEYKSKKLRKMQQ